MRDVYAIDRQTLGTNVPMRYIDEALRFSARDHPALSVNAKSPSM